MFPTPDVSSRLPGSSRAAARALITESIIAPALTGVRGRRHAPARNSTPPFWNRGTPGTQPQYLVLTYSTPPHHHCARRQAARGMSHRTWC
ncbi:hypothetical protein BC628DRAFT_1384824 [Trametes gibbosa]|nr:hypothetical protein BC628DRAFT_1384824 [Trametes gibbosa]